MKEWHRSEWRALGSKASIQVFSELDVANDMILYAFNWLKSYEDQVSRFLPNSETSVLNKDKVIKNPGKMLLETMSASINVADKTMGIIDPLMGDRMIKSGYTADAQWDSVDWAEAWEQPTHIASACPRQEWKNIELLAKQITLPSGYSYDPGGVGKGWAADHLARLLAGQAPALLIDLGGDIRIESEDSGLSFPIHIQDPRNKQQVAEVGMNRGAIATSSCCRRLWVKGGKPYHHLLSPADGQPVWSGFAGASAYAPSVLEAEAVAKLVVLTGDDSHMLYGGWVYPADPSEAARKIEAVDGH